MNDRHRHTMTWSWKLARIDVYVHATFLMLLGWIAMIHWPEGRSVAAVVSGIGFILCCLPASCSASSATPLPRSATRSRTVQTGDEIARATSAGPPMCHIGRHTGSDLKFEIGDSGFT